MKIVAGSYEGFCYGWDVATKKQGDDGAAVALPVAKVTLAFGAKVHQACVKAVALAPAGPRAGRLLVTGGADERIRIFDLETRVEVGELLQHGGTVNCLEFVGPNSTHLLSGSDDKTIAIWRCHDWALLHVLGGHKGAVTSVAAHFSGRMALSVGRDRTVRLWNLVEGRAAFIKRLPGSADEVQWSPDGATFVVAIEDTLHVYDSASCAPVASCHHPARVNGVCYISGNGGDGRIVTCANDGILRGWTTAGAAIWQLDASEAAGGRLRAVAFVPAALVAAEQHPAAGDRSKGRLITASAAGGVQMWSEPAAAGAGEAAVAAGTVLAPRLLLKEAVSGGPRFTCLAVCGDVAAKSKAATPQEVKVANGAGKPSKAPEAAAAARKKQAPPLANGKSGKRPRDEAAGATSAAAGAAKAAARPFKSEKGAAVDTAATSKSVVAAAAAAGNSNGKKSDVGAREAGEKQLHPGAAGGSASKGNAKKKIKKKKKTLA